MTDFAYKMLSVVMFTPLLSLVIQYAPTIKGETLIADVDLALFFFGPIGFICATLLGSLWLLVVALEITSLLFVLSKQHGELRWVAAESIVFAIRRVPVLLRITVPLLVRSLLLSIPFAVIGLSVYRWLLGEYDINFYLQSDAAEFKIAVAIGVVLLIVLAVILLRIWTSWFLAIPNVLFAHLTPREAISQSKRSVRKHQWIVLRWLVSWGAIAIALHFIAATATGFFGDLLIPNDLRSLTLLAVQSGIVVLFASTAGYAVNAFATIMFAALTFYANKRIGAAPKESLSDAELEEPAKSVHRWRLTTFRLLAAGAVFSLTILFIGFRAINTVRVNDDAVVLAHRGASMSAPENTLAAIRQAIEDRADWVEIDVQETADGEVVVIHDSDLMKLAKNPAKIWNLRIEDLAQIDIGSYRDPKFADQRVPTLRQVLELCKGKIGVVIELKYYGHDKNLEESVVKIVEDTATTHQVQVMSLKHDAVKKMKKLRPTWKCGLLMSVTMGNAAKVDADFVAVNARFVDRKFVQRMHAANKQVYVWTVNDLGTMSMMLNRDVDGLLTDNPKLARDLLAERKTMSTSERLLVELAYVLGMDRKAADQ